MRPNTSGIKKFNLIKPIEAFEVKLEENTLVEWKHSDSRSYQFFVSLSPRKSLINSEFFVGQGFLLVDSHTFKENNSSFLK